LLYVEDEVETREALSEIIRHRYPDVRLLVADNGNSGLEIFKLHLPDIVITDINMPIANGISMAIEIKVLKPSTEIIALTAYSSSQYLLQAIEAGFSHYILKPINVEEIFKIIDKVLSSIRSERLVTLQNQMILDLNEQLTRKAAELESANKDLESFNYTVAHDLRSPLVTISGFAQVLLEVHATDLNDASKEYLEIIQIEIHRMNSLIGALLRFSINSLKHVEKQWTNLSGMVNEIKDNLLTQNPQRKVAFLVAEEVNCFGDPELLRIVLENLIENAMKYSSKKKNARIEFGTISTEEDIVYFIRDNGAGFDNKESGTLFAPFQRIQCDDDIKGFGIGLATVQRIIERHGGRVWADGVKGKGATFSFTL
jgi:signal transduction histidine kinase